MRSVARSEAWAGRSTETRSKTTCASPKRVSPESARSFQEAARSESVSGTQWKLSRRKGACSPAAAVSSHPVTCLLEEDRYPRGWEPVIVSLADKHVEQAFLTIDERLDAMAGRHPEYREEIDAARPAAHALERELAEAAGLEVAEVVKRLRAAWAAGSGDGGPGAGG